ncbi:type I glutamate--ammonia ligase [Lujinxingia litoralis]|uniref:Glutamine synthetase n=1 Tax=Lujinxingia litoralis TaxID=2211119 RepID=A0A328C9M5_9DELT|nr:type I glutamate--ammonia ligase [Lujinxingia litoralis]RAL25337.1 type I glutamate--ammonia ligase [Lujinxingia litoralis]
MTTAPTITSIKDAIEFAREQGAIMADLKFMDFLGTWQHLTIPTHRLDEELFEDGLGFDGSSLRAWQPIHASDMQLRPDPTSARMDPFCREPTVSFICNVFDPITGQPYSRDPRYIAQKAENYLKTTGIADTAYFGPEAEFFIFDDIRYSTATQHSFYKVDSVEGAWNTGRDEGPNLGYKPALKGGYFPVAPNDSLHDLRTEMSLVLEQCGVEVDVHHHEVATGGQSEIGIRFNSLVRMADDLQWFKYVIKNVARRHNKTVTFMPKPLHGDNGSGMHTHMSLWKGNQPLFAGEGYAGMSELGLQFIAGILHHARALTALTNPTTNSFKRLVPGYEAPIRLAYSSRNRSAAVRIPTYASSPKARRMEFRTPDASANGYLAFAAMLMAGLDGIEKQMDPGAPLDKDIYNLPPEELARVPSAPANLEEAMVALAEDHEFLLRGDVFTEDAVEAWISYKMEKEIQPSHLHPTPLEFAMYFDV